MSVRTRRAPRLVVWISGVTFAVLAGVLGLVFLALSWQTDARLAESAAAELERGQQWFADVEARRSQERRLQAAVLAENPTLKAAVDTYLSELAAGTPAADLLPTVAQETLKLAMLLGTPALAVAGADGRILASAGPRAGDWPPGAVVAGLSLDAESESVIDRPRGLYLVTTTPLLLGPEAVGTVLSASPLDDAYAQSLGTGARADIVVVRDGRVVARSSNAVARGALPVAGLPEAGVVGTEAGRYAVRRLSAVGSTAVYALSSVDAAAAATTSQVTRALLAVGVLALALAVAASGWLARRLARPIDALTASLARMADARDLAGSLPRSGVSRSPPSPRRTGRRRSPTASSSSRSRPTTCRRWRSALRASMAW